MCGRLNIANNEFSQALCNKLNVDLGLTSIVDNRFVRAASRVQIIREVKGERKLQWATWWLLLEPSDGGFKPSRYTSFNTRYDKLNVPRSAGYQPFRQSRCIIPARGFGETEFEQKGSKKVPMHYHDFTAVNSAIAFGGLCKEYINKQTGEVTLGCSVITLPPHEKLMSMHSKASPLMLPQDETLDAWLDRDNQNVAAFNTLLQPNIPQDLSAVEIDKPSHYKSIAEPVIIKSDKEF
jgi:putative SOS response-associated peptidase YedK